MLRTSPQFLAGRIDTRVFLACAALVALLVPGEWSQEFRGLPLSPLTLIAVSSALFMLAALPAPHVRPAVWLALGFLALAIGKSALFALTPPVGFEARYWAGPTAAGTPERSTDFLSLGDATRVDLTLNLRGNDFPIHFVNDANRFNFGPDVRPGRDQMPFTVHWDGVLDVPADGPRRLLLESVGAASVRLDGRELIALPAAEGDQTAESRLPIAAGRHAVHVEYTRPEARAPRLGVSWEATPGASLEPLGAPAVVRNGAALFQTGLRPAQLTGTGRLVDALLAVLLGAWLLLGLAGLGRRSLPRLALGAVPLLFLGYGMAVNADVAGRATVLSGLDDWLTYESAARDVLLNGPLMTNGADSGPPYYAQPLYSYALALAHAATGEGLFGPLALQYAGVGLVLVATMALGARLFGPTVGLAALALFWAFLQQEHLKVARALLTENVYMPLVMASLLVLVRLSHRRCRPSWWGTLVAGGLLGLAAVTRSQFLLFVPLALGLLLLAWRRNGTSWPRSTTRLVLMLVGLALVIAPFTLRNWLVSKEVVPIASSGSASLLEFHRPPRGFDLSGIGKDPLYEALRLDRNTRTVVEFARRDPVGYVQTVLPLAGHTVGLTGLRRGDGSIYWGFLGTFVLYLAAFLSPKSRRLPVWFIHAFVATHLVLMALFEADTYGFRLVIPMYAPVVVVAALSLVEAARWCTRAVRPWSPRARLAGRTVSLTAIASAAFACLALGMQVRGLVELWPQRELSFHGLGGAIGHATLVADREGAALVYVASVDGSPRHFGSGNLPGLRYPSLKWFDPARSVPIPPEPLRAVYDLAELTEQPPSAWDLVSCLGTVAGADETTVSASAAADRCLSQLPGGQAVAQFGSLAQVDAVVVPPSASAGEQVDALLVWRPLRRHPEPLQMSLHVTDGDQSSDGLMWGNGTAQLYPASEWEPGERVLSRLPIALDRTAIPGSYPLTLGVSAAIGSPRPVPATWPGGGGDRVPVGAITLRPSSVPWSPLDVLPPGMQLVDGDALEAGGLKLLAVRPPGQTAAPGDHVRVGLLWRTVANAPRAAQCRLRLVREDGNVVQQVVMPVARNGSSLGSLRVGNVVRGESSFIVAPHISGQSLVLNVDLLDDEGASLSDPTAGQTVATIQVADRQHRFDAPSDGGVAQRATFGGKVELLNYELDPTSPQSGSTMHVRLRWQGLAEMGVAYKVFVHVLDQRGEHVVAQHDAEPQAGRAPTTGWLPGELLEDGYAIDLPKSLAGGSYPIEIGLYDPRSGIRLPLANGEDRVILSTRLTIQ